MEGNIAVPRVQPHKLNVITNSLRNTFLDCSYKYYLEYIRRLSPNVTPDYFVWGSMVHLCMDKVWEETWTIQQVQDELRRQIEEESVKRNFSPWLIEQYEAFILLLPTVLDAYLLHYKHEIGKYELVYAEREFELALEDGWVFQGKIDKVVRDTTTGVVYLKDFKTPSATGEQFWHRMPLDSQMKGYILALQRAVGIQTNFVMYDIIQKPSRQKKPVEGDPEGWAERVGSQYILEHEKIFQRKIIEYPQAAIDAYYHELLLLQKQIAHHQQEGLWIQHHPGNRIGMCPFFNICAFGETPEVMKDFYVRDLDDYNKELQGTGGE